MRFRYLIALIAILLCSLIVPQGQEKNTQSFSIKDFREIPPSDSFPQVGLRWRYSLEHHGFSDETPLATIVDYTIVSHQPGRNLWQTLIAYDKIAAGGLEYETISEDHVFFHPPRSSSYKILQYAPFPAATPGDLAPFEYRLTLGKGWEPNVGKAIDQSYKNTGYERITTQARTFEKAWHVVGFTPGWTGDFWWVDRIGFVKMHYISDEGIELKLELVGFGIAELELPGD